MNKTYAGHNERSLEGNFGWGKIVKLQMVSLGLDQSRHALTKGNLGSEYSFGLQLLHLNFLPSSVGNLEVFGFASNLVPTRYRSLQQLQLSTELGLDACRKAEL